MRHIESKIQQNCVTWFRLAYPQFGKLLIAIPNGGYRNALEAMIMKREGVVAGVADMVLFLPSKNYSTLQIEMKTSKGKQSALQKDWQKLVEKYGHKYVVCRSLEEFKQIINDYIKID